MAKSLGSPFWLLLVWLAMGLMTLCGALCYGELASYFPEAGGGYVYLRETLGGRLAFLYGWNCLLILDPGITAALATGMASYVGLICGWAVFAKKSFAIGTILVLCVMNVLNTRLGAGFLRGMTWLKLSVLALLPIWAVVFRLGSWSHFAPFFRQRPGSDPLSLALAGALLAAFFSFGGWWDVSKIAGEVRDPARTLPRALVLGVLTVTAVYFLISVAFVYLVPMEKVTSDETFVAQAGRGVIRTHRRRGVGRGRGGMRAGKPGSTHTIRASRVLCDGARWCFSSRGGSSSSPL